MSEPTISRIPVFASREEEAAFWDQHDFSDYLDELQPVTMQAPQLSVSITVRLTPDMVQQLRRQAQARGVNPRALEQR